MLDFLAHFDQELGALFVEYGAWMYVALFTIAFLEATVTPFVPGDALVFAVGVVASTEVASFPLMWALLVTATLAGSVTSYELGRRVGPLAFREDRRFLNAEQLAHVRILFERFGAKILVVGRFVPLVRTFAPVVAGMTAMPYSRFLAFSVVGIVLWVSLLTGAGYFVEHVPILHDNFGLLLAAIFVLSFAPLIFEWFWEHLGRPLFRKLLPRLLGQAYVYARESGRMVVRGTAATTRQIFKTTRPQPKG
ncbi:MAG: VTT domain-containing protein [Rhodothermales bacterium]|nr:VTT domain-containing protein [Rhodothermales bacterium]MBO6778328.1 VTT domain-containing protein [Rhodothermales bacterium]